MAKEKIVTAVDPAKGVQVEAGDKRAGDMKVSEHVQVQQSADIEASIKRTEGQRNINATWERTQAIIAVSVTLTVLAVSAILIIRGEGELGAFLLLSNVFFLVVGSYFQRTNHTKSSGNEQDHR